MRIGSISPLMIELRRAPPALAEGDQLNVLDHTFIS
jgi:hypothetical protein